MVYPLRSLPFGKMTGHSLLCLLRGCRKGKSIRTQGTMGREKERERDLSSLPIVHARLSIFLSFLFYWNTQREPLKRREDGAN